MGSPNVYSGRSEPTSDKPYREWKLLRAHSPMERAATVWELQLYESGDLVTELTYTLRDCMAARIDGKRFATFQTTGISFINPENTN